MAGLFGTDGVRGIAGRELGCELAMNLGKAAAHHLGCGGFLVARDTRLSSPMLATSVMSGLCSMGAQVTDLGILPTPALAMLVKCGDYNGGIMISASHNPWEYNGIKIFDAKGHKLSLEAEAMIERLLFECRFWNEKEDCGTILRYHSADRDYVSYLINSIDEDLSGFNIALDCANGAVCSSAGLLLEELGCRYTLLSDFPDGRNINRECGSTDMRALARFVADNSLDLGIALDGDGDRCLFTDERGQMLDGDILMGIAARDMLGRGALRSRRLVATVMSNIGLTEYCESLGIECELCDVGDRNVAYKMKEMGANLGGEQSGHLIFSDHSEHGDGLLTALKILSAVKRSGKSISALASDIPIYPREERNAVVSEAQRERFTSHEGIREIIAGARLLAGKTGRVIVRASGTEPCIRIMVQGNEAKKIADRLEKEIKKLLESE